MRPVHLSVEAITHKLTKLATVIRALNWKGEKMSYEPTQKPAHLSVEAITHELMKLATAIRALNWKGCPLNDAAVKYTKADKDLARTLQVTRDAFCALIVDLYRQHLLSEQEAKQLHTQWTLIPPILVDAQSMLTHS